MIKQGEVAGRIGEISISVDVINRDPDAFELLMKNFYPVHADYNFMTNKIKYVGYSHFFRVKDINEFEPVYEVIFNRYPSGTMELIIKEKKGF